jgi:hypothetical protein
MTRRATMHGAHAESCSKARRREESSSSSHRLPRMQAVGSVAPPLGFVVGRPRAQTTGAAVVATAEFV